jgi:hypothetical protein
MAPPLISCQYLPEGQIRKKFRPNSQHILPTVREVDHVHGVQVRHQGMVLEVPN